MDVIVSVLLGGIMFGIYLFDSKFNGIRDFVKRLLYALIILACGCFVLASLVIFEYVAVGVWTVLWGIGLLFSQLEIWILPKVEMEFLFNPIVMPVPVVMFVIVFVWSGDFTHLVMGLSDVVTSFAMK